MVNGRGTFATLAGRQAAERRVILSYAPARARSALAALLALDDALSAVLRSTREPIVGRMRLTWWHAALVALDHGPPPGEPVLAALAEAVVPRVSGAALAALVDGWEALLDDVMTDAALADYVAGRGGTLFALGAALLGDPSAPSAAAGAAWALADLAGHSSDPALAERAAAEAGRRLAPLRGYRWPRATRPLGAMLLLARRPDRGAAWRIGRILVHRLTGF